MFRCGLVLTNWLLAMVVLVLTGCEKRSGRETVREPCPGTRARTAQLPFPGFCCGLGKGQIRVSHAGAAGRGNPAGCCIPGAANMTVTVGGDAGGRDLISGPADVGPRGHHDARPLRRVEPPEHLEQVRAA